VFVSLVRVLVSLDRSLVGSWIVDLVISDGLWASQLLFKHHELHVVLFDDLILKLSLLIHLIIRVHLLGVISIASSSPSHHTVRHGHGIRVLIIEHDGSGLVLKMSLLLVGINRNVSIDTVEILLLLCKHLSTLVFFPFLGFTNQKQNGFNCNL
jgi:hypothetical protein